MRLGRSIPVAILAALAIAAASTPAFGAAADTTGLPYVTAITTAPSTPCMGTPTSVVLSGYFSACQKVVGQVGTTVVIDDPTLCGHVCAPTVITPWADTLGLGLLAAGNYSVRLVEALVCSTSPDTQYHETTFQFSVAPTCPPPQINPMSYVSQVQIRDVRTGQLPICPQDSILVALSGNLPSTCYVLKRVDLIPSPIVGPMPEPDIVRLVFDSRCCAELPCAIGPVPWQAFAVLPSLPSRDYGLIVEAVEVCCSDTVKPDDPHGSAVFPFRVAPAESCATPTVCLLPLWDRSHAIGTCDAGFDADGKARLTFLMHSTVALAGVQGAVDVTAEDGTPDGLYVSKIEAIGPAAGMHLTWEPATARDSAGNTYRLPGVRFVLFAESGAPIPATTYTEPVPILRFTFEHVATTAQFAPDPNRRWFVRDHDVLGSDINGLAVPNCPVRAGDLLVRPVTICAGGQCDLNGDAVADVRDLVLMVHCLLGTGPCPADTVASLDCNGDHAFDLDDVLCCAHTVLGNPGCVDCPVETVRAEPRIAFAFGEPKRVTGGIDVPIHVEGSDRIGAARFALRLPASLVNGATVTLDGSPTDWLSLGQPVADGLVVGVIDLHDSRSLMMRVASLDLVLHVPLAAGAEPEGEVALASASFSGPDGVKLAADLGSPVVRLGAGAALTLEPAKPNPFGASTTLRLTLDATANVDFGIYDIAGRRVASLHRGSLELGVHAFVWEGRSDDGTRVPAGVYFARATVNGVGTMRKLVMVRSN